MLPFRTSQAAPPPHRARRFFDLSPDVRRIIYEEALVFEPVRALQCEGIQHHARPFNSAIAVPDYALISVPRLKHLPPLALTPQILRINKQIYEEARVVLYGWNYFRADWVVQNPLNLFGSKIHGICHWVEQIGNSNAAKVRFLYYRLQYPEEGDIMRAVYNDFFVSVLSSTAKLKGLQCFAIAGNLRDFHASQISNDEVRDALFKHPLLQTLLRIKFSVRPLIDCECMTPETRLRFLSEDRRWPEGISSHSLELALESERGLFESGAYDIVAGSCRLQKTRVQELSSQD